MIMWGSRVKWNLRVVQPDWNVFIFDTLISSTFVYHGFVVQPGIEPWYAKKLSGAAIKCTQKSDPCFKKNTIYRCIFKTRLVQDNVIYEDLFYINIFISWLTYK